MICVDEYMSIKKVFIRLHLHFRGDQYILFTLLGLQIFTKP